MIRKKSRKVRILASISCWNPLPAKATEPAARQVARRHSKYGRRLREEGTGSREDAGVPETVGALRDAISAG